jgi:hypothetical protein
MNMGLYLELADKALAEIKAPHCAVVPNDINDINDKRRAHRLSLVELREQAGKDWPECENDPALVEVLARAVQARRMRERGEVPPHYTATTVCAGCGAVPIFPGAPERVLVCPWCLNRAAGQPIPKTKP